MSDPLRETVLDRFGACDNELVERVARRRLNRQAKERPMITPEELARSMTGMSAVQCELSPFRWFVIISALQLALRHQGLPSTCRVVVTDWINEMATSFPVEVQELIEAGFNPQFEHPVI